MKTMVNTNASNSSRGEKSSRRADGRADGRARGEAGFPKQGTQRAYHAQGLANLMPKVTRKMAGRRPTLVSNLQTLWPEIVGPKLAQFTRPARLAAKVLKLEVANGAGPIIALQQDIILSKVSLFLGADKVIRLTFQQVDFPLPQKMTPTDQDQDSVRPLLDALTDGAGEVSGQETAQEIDVPQLSKLDQALEMLRQRLDK